MKKFLSEFKKFAFQDNIMNLAIGVIIGAALKDVVTSLTDNILSPLIGLVAGHNFDELRVFVFGVTLSYGAFITSIINFLIMAFVVFLMVRTMTKVMTLGKKGTPAPTTKKCPYCVSEISVDAVRCPNCTSELKTSDASKSGT